MKSIFTKLGALLLIGVVTLVGCTDFSADLKEVNDRVANNEEAIKALKKEMADLKAEIVGKYATLNDIENVLATVASLQEALEAKADKQSVLEVADKLAEFETPVEPEVWGAIESSLNQSVPAGAVRVIVFTSSPKLLVPIVKRIL